MVPSLSRDFDPRPSGACSGLARVSLESFDRLTIPSLSRDKLLGSASKPARPPVAVLRAVRSEDVVFVNNPG